MQAASDRQVEGSKPSEPHNLVTHSINSPSSVVQDVSLSIKIGLLVTITGICASAYFFLDAEKVTESFSLGIEKTGAVKTYLAGSDVGFFRVYIPDFEKDAMFVQILDPLGNIIADKKIETKMAINYFDVYKSGIYTVKATNLSEGTLYFEIEFGQTNSQQVIYPGIVIVVGVILVIISVYSKLKNYNMAQPDENIS